MLEFLFKLFDTDGFPPRWNCGDGWTPGHGWLHIISDTAIFSAYAAIPVVLIFFALRRRDMPFPAVLTLFAAFIMFCGVGHLIEATIFWHPWYRLSGVIKFLTAIASWATVIAMIPLVPKALALPGLASINERLQGEVNYRERLELQMKQEIERTANLNTQLKRFNTVAVDRELQMIALKREINELMVRQGSPPRYDITLTESSEASTPG